MLSEHELAQFHAERRYHNFISAMNQEQLQTLLNWIRSQVHSKVPDAHVTTMVDQKGRQYKGIFKLPVELTYKKQYAREQFAPQQLSTLLKFDAWDDATFKLRRTMELWLSAHMRLEYPNMPGIWKEWE
jgi:hypothetical protein